MFQENFMMDLIHLFLKQRIVGVSTKYSIGSTDQILKIL